MRQLNKLFIMLLCCVGTLSVISCVGNDDDGIDPALYKQYLSDISGTYYGNNSSWKYTNKILFYNDTLPRKGTSTSVDSIINEKVDSISNIVVTFSSDSSFVVSGCPGRLLAKELPQGYEDLKEAVENAAPQMLKGKFEFIFFTNAAYFTVYPEAVTYPNLTYGGETHKVSFYFWQPSFIYGMYGNLDQSHKTVLFNVYLSSVIIDDDTENPITLYNGDTSNRLQLAKSLLQISAVK